MIISMMILKCIGETCLNEFHSSTDVLIWWWMTQTNWPKGITVLSKGVFTWHRYERIPSTWVCVSFRGSSNTFLLLCLHEDQYRPKQLDSDWCDIFPVAGPKRVIFVPVWVRTALVKMQTSLSPVWNLKAFLF